jgi:integrase
MTECCACCDCPFRTLESSFFATAPLASWKSTGGKDSRNWLTVEQAQALLNALDFTTTKGLRDRAILAVLLGCGLRRSELAPLTFGHLQQRDGRWCIVDLKGKHRPHPNNPHASLVATDAWTSAGNVVDRPIFRPVGRGDVVGDVGLSEQVVWQLLRPEACAESGASAVDFQLIISAHHPHSHNGKG